MEQGKAEKASNRVREHPPASPKGRVGNDLYEPETHKIAAYAKVNKTVYKNRHLRYFLYFW